MPRHGREDDRRSSPYHSSKDRRSHYHKHKDHGAGEKQFKKKDWSQSGEKNQYQRQDGRTTVRYHGGKTKNEDCSNRRIQECSRYYKHGGDREKQYRKRSLSESDDEPDRKSTSQSNSPRGKSKRTSGFDVAPPVAAAALPNPSEQVAGVSIMAPQTIPGLLQNVLAPETSQVNQLGTLFPIQAMTQQVTGHARRVYVGGLPPLANEQTISRFFSHVMNAIGGNSAGPGDAVMNVYINHEKKFAFVEMRTVEEASNAMALDGIVFEGVSVRVRRPTDYNPSLAAPLGPSQPSPYLNLAAAGLTPGMIGEAEGADRIFLGGVPYYFSEAQIKELLESFGPLRGFDLVKDRDTGNSKGYGFCIYKDPSVTDVACAALNGLKVGDKTLTVRRATVSGQLKPEQEYMLAQAQQHIAMQKMSLGAGAINLSGGEIGSLIRVETPTKILCLTEVVTIDELMDDGEYKEILEDMREECQKFGELIDVVIPRPLPNAAHSDGIGKVFLEYSDVAGCTKAKSVLSGRKFGGNTVIALYYPEDKYYGRDYTA
ncbi:Splicing factor U2AF, large subunit (RRM superfamily) [Handroanthus impetiginosus]|uniref:Splicing factor U2af large subunit n=1 Tax=Handroanthus impetiginosus TaxID=429701 RepID=A0A2G9G0J6_9LAMI|nr:Splicing factor U2AF, large subunit (RRM superfamily) [Handroanthus impetiginosus]